MRVQLQNKMKLVALWQGLVELSVAERNSTQTTAASELTVVCCCCFTGSIESLVVKFADGGPKKRQQSQQNHGMIIEINVEKRLEINLL